MKKMMKSLLMMALAVFVGTAFAADPVAIWTDFNSLTSGNYTLVENGNTISDGVLTIGSKPSYIAGTTTWDPRATGNAVVLAMRVTNLDLTKVSALVSLKLGEANNQLGLMTDGEGGMDAMWNGGIRGGNNAISAKLSLAATEYIVVFKYSNWGTQAWAIGNDGVFAQYTSDSACKGGTNTAGADIRIGALYGAGSPATGLQIHSMTLWNTNEAIEDVIAACATEEMKTNRAFVENGTGAEYTATVAEDVNLSEIVWTKVADDTTVTTANLPNGAKLKIDASNNPVITNDVAFANKLIYTANPLTVTAAITPNQNDYSAIIPGIVSNPSYEIFPAGLFVGPGAVTYTATLNAPLGYEIVVAGNRATLKTVDSATLGIPSFGVNFYNNDAAKVAGTEVQGAYPIKGAAWTDVQGQSSTAVTSFNLADAAGNITENTTMSLERTQGARQWGLNNMPSSALLKGYIDDSNGNPTTLTFSNIPYAQYRVIVYMSTDTANYTFAPVSIGGISYASTVGNSATATVASSSNWGHTGPNHNANDLAEGVNYLVSPMMTSDSCVISTVRSGDPRATIAAVQFIDCTAENRTMTLPGQEITLDANTNISDLDFTETAVLITVKPGVTLTFDEAVPLDSLRVVAEGTAESPVKFDATVTAPFANIGSVSLEGTAVELVADIYVDAKPSKTALEVIAIASNTDATADTPQEVASTIAIASGKTLKTKGYLNFTAANTIAGTLEVVSGVTTFNLARVDLSGTLKVAAGATFKNGTNDGPKYNGAPTLDIAGTLEIINNARWSLPSRSTTTLREGAVLKGAGGTGYNYAFDWFEGATINVLGDATIEGNIGGHNPGAILTFNVAEGKTLTIAGKFDGGTDRGNSSLAVSGAGTLKLTNAENDYRGTTTINASATLELDGGSLGTGAVTVADGATIAGSGTIGGTLTLVAGSTVDATDGSLTVNGEVTLSGEGDVTVKVAETAEAGDTVITCANAEDVAAQLTGAPEGFKYVAKDGAVKLAASTVTVTLPAAPANTKWYMGETEVSGTIAVDPNTDVTLTLKADDGYVFADGSTSKDYTVNSGETGAEVETPDVTAATPVAIVNGTKYQTLEAAFAAAQAGDTITLLADVTCTGKPVFSNGGIVNVDVNGHVFVSTETARVRNVASADGAVPSNNIKFVSGFGWEVYRPNTTEGVNFRVFPTLDAVMAYEPAQPNSARIYPYEDVKQDKDVVLRKYGNGTSSTICIDPEYDITWDLNGYTVLQESPTGNPLEACVRGKFTLKDSSDEQTGKWIAGACGVTDPDNTRWYGSGGPAFYLLGEGELILKGGTVSIARNATPDMEGNEIINTGGLIYLEDGKLTVDGATLQVDDAYGIVIWGGEAVIQSGTFDLDPSESWALFASASAKVTINSPVTGAILVVSGADVTVNVPGVAYYEGPGYVAPAVGEGLMAFDGLVLEKGVAVVTNATSVTPYATFADALTAAQAGDTITLMADVTASDIIVLDKAITLDGNGKTLTSTAARAINVSGADGVTIKNLTIDAKGERAINIIQGATNVTIDNVTATAANYTVNVAASAPEAVVAIKNSTLDGLCTVNVSAEGAQVTVDNSTVNCNDNNATVGESYAALSLNKEAVGGSIVATDTTVNVTEGSDSMKGRNGAENGTVTINGSTDDVAVMVAAITYEGSDYYYTFDSLESAIDFAEAGNTITLLRDVTASEIITINKAITLDGNGKTLTYTGSNRAIEMPNNAEAKLNVTLKNLTVDCTASYCQRGINYNDDGALVLNNVTVKGTNVTYALNLPGYSDNCVVEITDSSLTGNIALNVWGANSTITATNSEFVSVDNSNAEGYVAISLNNDGAGNAATGSVVTINGGKIIAKDENDEPSYSVRNSTATGRVNVSESTEVVGKIVEPVAIVTYGMDQFYSCATLQAAIDKAIETKGTVELLKDISASEIITINGSVVIDGKDHTLTSTAGRAINVSGADGVTIKNLTINASGERAINIIQNATNVTIDNVTATAANYTVNVASSAPNAVVAITNSTLDGLCTVNVSAEGAQVTVDNSTVNCNDNNTTAGESYAALSLNKDAVGGSIIATNTTVNVTEGSDSMKGRNSAEDGTVTINGSTDDVAVMVAAITYEGSDYYYTFDSLESAIEFAEAGNTITLLRDVTASEIITINKAITLDGNGKTLTSTAARAINVSGADGVTIKNLTIDAKGERAINIIQGATNVTIDNVTATAANYTVNVAASAPNAVVSITDSTLNGLCTVNVSAEGAQVTVDNSTVNCNDNNATVGESYAALSLNKEAVGGSIVATDTTVNVTEGSDSMKGRNSAEDGTVTINGSTDDVAVMVAAITYEGSDYYYTFDSLESAIEFAEAGDTIKVIAEVNVDAAIEVAKKVTIDLNGQTVRTTENDKSGDGVFCVVAGGDLTINDSVGTGVINGVGGNNYNIAIWANGGKVTINGGNFTNVGATDNTDPNAHFDLIYVKNGGEVVINGGTFECETPAFTLNSHDTYKGVITVNGGTFVGFDPRNNAAETAGTTFMAAGKYTFAEGGNYIVVTPEDYFLNGVASNSATVGDVDSLLAGAVTVTKDGEKYVATATYTFKVTAVDTVNPEKSSYELTGGKLRPGKTVAVKYIDLATGTEAWEKPEADTVTFKLVIK